MKNHLQIMRQPRPTPSALGEIKRENYVNTLPDFR